MGRYRKSENGPRILNTPGHRTVCGCCAGVTATGCIDNVCEVLVLANETYTVTVSGDAPAFFNGSFEVTTPGSVGGCGTSGIVWSFNQSFFNVGFWVFCHIVGGECCLEVIGGLSSGVSPQVTHRRWQRSPRCLNLDGADTPSLNDFLPITLPIGTGGFATCALSPVGSQMVIS
jgi:hypothetical protein